MTTVVEETDQVVEPDPEVVAAQAAFEGGFSDKPTEDTPPAEKTEPEKAETEPEKVETPVEEHVQITKAQFEQLQALLTEVPGIKAGMGKLRDDLFGKVGGFERTLKEAQAATPAGEDVKIGEEDLPKELLDDYGFLVKPMLEAFNKGLGKLKVKGTKADDKMTPHLDPAKVGELVRQGISQALTEPEMRMTVLREDWKQIIGVPDDKGVIPATAFRTWLATQPAEYQQEITNTANPRLLDAAITKFEEASKTPKDEKPNPRKERIASAVPPKGTPAVTPGAKSEHDHFKDGFGDNEA